MSTEYELADDLFIGQQFSTFAEFQKVLKQREELTGEKWVKAAGSRGVSKANEMIQDPKRHFRADLEYAFIHLRCTYSGTFRASRTPGKRIRMSKKMQCPAHIFLSADRNEDALIMKRMTLTHNHEPLPETPSTGRRRRGTKRKPDRTENNEHRIIVFHPYASPMESKYRPSQDPTQPVEDKQEQILLAPYKYICQIPGKQIRTKLSAAFNYWLKISDEKMKIIAEVIQMLHNASLLVDDIEDNSKLRRGIPVTHSIFGIPQTLNAANYVYFLGLEKLFTLGKLEKTTRVFTEHLLELHRGQGMDIYWRDAVECPTEEEYKIMVIRKTGGLFGLAVQLMQLFSENKSNFKPLLDLLGLYFQIRDDYANLHSKEYEANKSYCEDLTEGKFSFPIIHAVRANTEDTQVLSILRQRTTDNDVKKYCVEYLEKVGSFQYTRRVLRQLEQELLAEISSLGDNPHLTGLVMELRKIYSDYEEVNSSS